MGYPDVAWGVGEVGSLLSMRNRVFLSDGTFTVPDGITKIWITACGGGGSGNYMQSNNAALAGSSGTSTVIGSLITLAGGGGAAAQAVGTSGGIGGGNGGEGGLLSGKCNGGGGSLGGGGANDGDYNKSDKVYGCDVVAGGKASFGFNDGETWTSSLTQGVGCNGGFGAGGGGVSVATSSATYITPYGGGGGAAIYKKEFSVTPNQAISITVGKGGTASNSYAIAGSGGDGIVIIEW